MGLEKKVGKYKEVKSPVVGTYYDSATSSSHEKYDPKPYVKIGSRVTPETVVCDIEAMKVILPVKAGIDGIVKQKLVKNEEDVEYEQVLFRIKPTNKNK
jgi:acetyl-CoA carboxylase biotin carboxyl carrier protein